MLSLFCGFLYFHFHLRQNEAVTNFSKPVFMFVISTLKSIRNTKKNFSKKKSTTRWPSREIVLTRTQFARICIIHPPWTSVALKSSQISSCVSVCVPVLVELPIVGFSVMSRTERAGWAPGPFRFLLFDFLFLFLQLIFFLEYALTLFGCCVPSA